MGQFGRLGREQGTSIMVVVVFQSQGRHVNVTTDLSLPPEFRGRSSCVVNHGTSSVTVTTHHLFVWVRT